MGVLDKLKFWSKKESDFSGMDMGDDLGLGLDDSPAPGMGVVPPGGAPHPPGMAPPGRDDFGADQYGQSPSATPPEEPAAFAQAPLPPGMAPPAPAPPAMGHQPPQQRQIMAPSQPSSSKDYEIVSAKLDTIKAYLDTISQRLTNIENLIKHEKRW